MDGDRERGDDGDEVEEIERPESGGDGEEGGGGASNCVRGDAGASVFVFSFGVLLLSVVLLSVEADSC